MNKLMGFLELREMSLPSIPWKRYEKGILLDNSYLWTIRSAVYRGNDLNLPRLVGAKSEESQIFADNLLSKLGNNGMVIYYPYFIANKSGTLEVRRDSIVIEAVEKDLWNLVTLSDREVTIIIKENEIKRIGNQNFLSDKEINYIRKYVPEMKKIFRDDLLEGKSALFEWSFANSCNKDKCPIGDEYLVFYEARTI